MSRYIDADELKRAYAPLEGCLSARTLGHMKNIFDAMVDSMPVADVEEVVRCKDCIHLGVKDFVYGYCKDRMCGILSPNDYCSYGEKK